MNKNDWISIGPLRPKGLQVTAAEKAEWVRRFEQSGVPLSAFCAQYGLRVASLRNWRVRYADDSLSSALSSLCAQSPPDFMEMQLPAVMTAPAWSVELALGNGKVLRLNGEVPAGLVE